MTDLLEKAVEAVRRMPPADQDTIAQAIISMTEIGGADDIDPDHLQDVLDAMAEVGRGEYASAEEVSAAFRSFER
ncbi:hypothetical protein IPV08_13860 [Methylobacterium sp. SD274]|jgi:hypothetical protein|uniref:hypothetical protein n=1 Tax=unclassified Methylobacterium TaxID=2615210 RepID=UPI0006F226AD|nr:MULTISPECIES: hypothetical protein [unclassified Methylobacterium]KQO49993.1 hypothetical protein ASF24_23465 [Methylobacterium sp. Leaf86]KQO84784.1 hypothetical protein ASF32_11955 [Methylobacterium sp. Leaf91]MBO1021057.1 hypothetical protein [Methylobacterium sp. SD274]